MKSRWVKETEPVEINRLLIPDQYEFMLYQHWPDNGAPSYLVLEIDTLAPDRLPVKIVMDDATVLDPDDGADYTLAQVRDGTGFPKGARFRMIRP